MSVKSTINFGKGVEAIRAGCITAMPAVLSLIRATSDSKMGHDSGDMIGSGQTAFEGLQGAVGYNTPYVEYQHEGQRKDGSHVIRNRPAGGEGHFLESTINDGAIQAEVMDIFAAGITGNLG